MYKSAKNLTAVLNEAGNWISVNSINVRPSDKSVYIYKWAKNLISVFKETGNYKNTFNLLL